MAEPICEDEGLLQEWNPQTELLQKIPLKSQRGLFPQNLSLTCLDVLPEYITLGTNLGFVYWYCRVNGDLQRLRLENSNCSVTCVKIIASVDYMVAAGTNHGNVTVFQISKQETLPLSEHSKIKLKQVERFAINGLHNAPISSLEWSQDGFKVFSGDKNGLVVFTEIDLNLHISKSTELLNEQFEIIQLCYRQQILLISTVYRSIICDASNNWKVHQVGTKERKMLGKFGATICNFQHGLVVYASRPGHRLWLSDKNGIVQQTLIFKSAIQSSCPKIQLINPVIKKEPYDTNFGKVIQFGDNKLITYNSEILYVLHPGAVSIVSVLNNARKILDLAVNENEIFILEGERSLLRISPVPDKYTPDILYQPISRRTSFNLDEFAAKIKDTAVESLKKITKDLIITPEQTSPNSPPALADEALELPPIVNLPAGSMPNLFASKDIEVHSSPLNNQFDNSNFKESFTNFSDCSSHMNNGVKYSAPDCQEEIVIRPLRKRHNKNLKNLSKSCESVADSTSNLSDDRLVVGTINDLSLSDESALSQSQFSVLHDISTILNQQEITNKTENDERLKALDTKSQISLDTCESVSERLLVSSEIFHEEQEKTFARLANHSMFDSCNSEKTENMSISLNMTVSSSYSSKISENLISPSYTSDNSEVASRAKSIDSQSTDNIQSGNLLKNSWPNSNSSKENFSQEEKITGKESSVSSNNSQEERFYPKWSNDEEKNCFPDENCEKFCENNFCKHQNTSDKTDFFEENNLNDQQPNKKSHSDQLGAPSSINCSEKVDTQTVLFPKNSNKDMGVVDKVFLPEEPLSYGPPSGSSMLSSQPSSDFSSIPNNFQPQIGDSSDHWLQYKTPERIISFAASNDYVVCTDIYEKVYYSNLAGLTLSWTLLDYKALMIKVSNDGSVVWFLNNKSLFALVNPSSKSRYTVGEKRSPISSAVVEIAQNVKTFAIDSVNNEGWFVTSTGKIMRHNQIESNTVHIPCDYFIIDIDCTDEKVFALTNDNEIIYKTANGNHFKLIANLKPSPSSLALGPKNLLWIVDESNNIYFSDNFLLNDPQWWQVQISDYIYQNSKSFQNVCKKIKINELKANILSENTMIATNDNFVWIYHKFDTTIRVNKTGFLGYKWNKVSYEKLLTSIQWDKLCAEGVIEDKGRIWIVSTDGNIFCASPNYQNFQSISVPCEEKILCVSSSLDSLWVLSENGKIYSRLGLTQINISGISWSELKLPEIDNLRFIWVSSGSDVAWACDIHGRTFITVKSQNSMATSDPFWVEVEGRPKDVQFEKVFVGSQIYMVWAVDNKRNLYVREGIFPDYQIGTSWVYVCGIEATHVTISGSSVWALACNGCIYRRCGVSESNYIGDYWKIVPGTFKLISTSYTDEVWGISSDNQICKLNCNLKLLNDDKTCAQNKTLYSSKEDVSWEIVD